MVSAWNSYNVIQALLLAYLRAEKYIESSIVENHDEFIRIFAVWHSLEPFNMINTARFLHLFLIVVFDYSAALE